MFNESQSQVTTQQRERERERTTETKGFEGTDRKREMRGEGSAFELCENERGRSQKLVPSLSYVNHGLLDLVGSAGQYFVAT